MQVTKRITLRRRKAREVPTDRLEQTERRDHVGVDERRRAVNRAVDMRFSGEIQHRARAVACEQIVDQRAIADVATYEAVSRIVLRRRKVAEIAGVGKLVEIDDRLAFGREPVQHEVGADEAGAAGDEDHGDA